MTDRFAIQSHARLCGGTLTAPGVDPGDGARRE